jgi:hypothetical protein
MNRCRAFLLTVLSQAFMMRWSTSLNMDRITEGYWIATGALTKGTMKL